MATVHTSYKFLCVGYTTYLEVQKVIVQSLAYYLILPSTVRLQCTVNNKAANKLITLVHCLFYYLLGWGRYRD